LFNLCHASARNVIEQIFGILKQRFQILQLPPEYDMRIQALILPALAALHNFIREYDPKEIQTYDDEDDNALLDLQMGVHPESVGDLELSAVTPRERVRANKRRDKIAADMWEQYQHHLQTRVARDRQDR
jgi:hypothetical protein